ncbi:MAG: tetratricopeptide repeat protein [Longimicrobiales bacterium]
MAILVVCAGCATQSGGLASKSAGEIPTLTARLARDTANHQAQAALGAAYLQVGRPGDARPLLEKAVAGRPQDGTSIINLGLTYEALDRYGDARRLYEQYLKVGRSRALRNDLNQRLLLVHRKEMETAARQAVARERELSTTPPRPRTVAVFPFRVVQADSAIRPLGRALAELLVVDLSQTERLTVLERLQVQLLIDELDMSAAGLVDPRQAVRGGRMLSAERIVQGTLGGRAQALELNAAVVQVQDGAREPTAGRPALTETGELNRFMEAEKRLVFKIYETLGVQLTVAERERINRRATDNLQAILAYGLGLEALDAGNYPQAAQHFAEAVRIDPNFELAKEKAEQTRDLATATTVSTAELVEKAGIESALPPSRAADFFLPSILTRDPVAEVLGSEEVRRRTIIELIFRRPNN